MVAPLPPFNPLATRNSQLATLKPNKLRALLGGHPWILDGSLELIDKSNAPSDGSVVDVYSDKGRFFARGLYNSHSKIRVRLYTWNESESLDDAFWTKRISTAIDLRKELGYFSQATRLINSEGDALSGLIVDKYEDVLVMQATSLGILLRAEHFAQILQNLTGAKTVIATTEPTMARREGAPEELTADRVFGDPVPETMVIQSGGIKYEIQLLGGQKTGFYLDQRENRLAAAELFKGKTVLDMFCYHGGFSIAASQAGAVSCLACDSSAKALEQVKKNAQLNAVDNVETLQGDSFQILEQFKSEGRTFGGVVLDPPKFAQGKRSVQEALRGYHYLNKLGISCIAPGGFLVTCSCTGSVRREDFFDMLHGAATQAGRRIQILQQRGAAPDHPVLDSCPETDYLKCFLCRVI